MLMNVRQGLAQGASIDDALKVMRQGSDATEEDIQKYIEAVTKMQDMPVTDEMKDFSRIYEQEDNKFLGFYKGLKENPSVIPGIIAQSVANMANLSTLFGAAKGAAAGGVTGSAVPVLGTAAGAVYGSVFNQNPLENKIFKTMNLESDSAWQAVAETDIQQNGFIDDNWFVKKEGAYFAYLRQTGDVPALQGQYAMRSANGIGKSTSYSVNGTTGTLNFSINPLVSIGSIISIGDYLYFSLPSYTTISLAGVVTNIQVDLPNNINRITISTSVTGSSPLTINDAYILFIKNAEAESHGLLGHYCIFTVTNTSTAATELFAIESEVMKSYP